MNFSLTPGSAPLLVSIPHCGLDIPQDLRSGFLPRAEAAEDADRHLERLYAFARELGASILQARTARYVIDLNRPPDDEPMYPGSANTELCPTRFFDGSPLYAPGQAPSPAQRIERRDRYWEPYHRALRAELDRIRATHGHVLLWDAHSIRSEIPWLFEGRLPDLNIGTAGGLSAHPAITDAVARAASGRGLSVAVDGRFKGGYITRHYGRPTEGVDAVQLEMCQVLYMQEAPPFGWLDEPAARVTPVLRDMLQAALHTARSLHG